MIAEHIPQESLKLIKFHKLASNNVIILCSGARVSKGDGFFLSVLRGLTQACLSLDLSGSNKDFLVEGMNGRTHMPLPELRLSSLKLGVPVKVRY